MIKLSLWIKSIKAKKVLEKRTEKVLRMSNSSSIISVALKWFLKTTILIFFGGIILFPFFFMILTALMPIEQAISDNPGLIPETFKWSNFGQAFKEGYWFALLNTILVCSLSITTQIFVSMFMGYALAFKKFFGKKILWYLLLSILMLPQVALIVGQYSVVVSLGIQTGFSSILAMVLPFAASVFSAYMFKNAFEEIPGRTKEAALIDGIGDFGFFWKVAMPMVSPTVWTVGILTAFASWNAYMWPALLSTGTDNFRVILGIWLFTTGIADETYKDGTIFMNLRMAAAIISMIPLFIVYFVFRNKIMNAVAKRGSGIKG